MTNWASWKQRYKGELWHVAGFEELFVDKILSQIPQIVPSDVTPQYRFIDSTGKYRYIDFMIINKEKGYRLPIELDGFTKDKKHSEWNDFLERQNDLVTQFGIVLRFSNKQMFDSANNIIHKIQQTLKLQSESVTKNQIVPAKPVIQPHKKTKKLETIKVDKPKSNSNRLIMVLAAIAIGSIAFTLKWNQKPTRTHAQHKTKQLVDSDIEPIDKHTEERKEILFRAHVKANNVVQYVGSSQLVCGRLAEVYKFRSGIYLNFDKKFPDTPFTAVVWDSLYDEILQQGIRLENRLRNEVCVEGEISSYNGRTQVIVQSLDNLTL